MTFTRISTLFLLTITTFSRPAETEYSNDSITVNLNNEQSSLTLGSQRVDTFNNSTGNFQLRPSLENIPLDLGEQPFSVKSTNDDYVIESNLTNSELEEEHSGIPSTEEILEYIYPKTWTWALIFFHCVVFVVGLVGNCLVCVAVYRNRSMRTVTNYFIVNLAVADFLVILFCLPPSVVWDVTSTWWFGTAMCKTVLYLQVRLYINWSKKMKDIMNPLRKRCWN